MCDMKLLSRRRMKIVKTQLKVHTIINYVIYDLKLHSRRRMKIVKTQLKVHTIINYVIYDLEYALSQADEDREDAIEGSHNYEICYL
jgi:hypothetical protein